jgi:hypothetical protein
VVVEEDSPLLRFTLIIIKNYKKEAEEKQILQLICNFIINFIE